MAEYERSRFVQASSDDVFAFVSTASTFVVLASSRVSENWQVVSSPCAEALPGSARITAQIDSSTRARIRGPFTQSIAFRTCQRP